MLTTDASVAGLGAVPSFCGKDSPLPEPKQTVLTECDPDAADCNVNTCEQAPSCGEIIVFTAPANMSYGWRQQPRKCSIEGREFIENWREIVPRRDPFAAGEAAKYRHVTFEYSEVVVQRLALFVSQ